MTKDLTMERNTTIVLDDHFEKFISEEVNSGRFKSASEVVKTALQLLEIQEKKIKELRDEIAIGEESGMISNFDSEAHLESLNRQYL